MEELIEKFYRALQNKDAKTMNECYHKCIVFEDPAFGRLEGVKARAMWKMLCSRSKDLSVTFSDVQVNGDSGTAHWEATYTFSKTGRKVHNKIKAKFKFEDGLISEHQDHFNFKKWASQALGITGKLFGGMSFFKKQFQKQTCDALTHFMKRDA